MLTQIETRVVRQPDARIRRDWYQSASPDVVLQHDHQTGDLPGFEIEWEGRGLRRAYVTWTRGVGVRTGAVDIGEGAAAPITRPHPSSFGTPRSAPSASTKPAA